MADVNQLVQSIIEAAGRVQQAVAVIPDTGELASGALHEEVAAVDRQLWSIVSWLEEDWLDPADSPYMDETERHPPRPPKIVDVELPDEEVMPDS